MKTKVAKSYGEIRQLGYDAGVENERALVVRALEAEALAREALGLPDEAQALRFAAERIAEGAHLLPHQDWARRGAEPGRPRRES